MLGIAVTFYSTCVCVGNKRQGVILGFRVLSAPLRGCFSRVLVSCPLKSERGDHGAVCSKCRTQKCLYKVIYLERERRRREEQTANSHTE